MSAKIAKPASYLAEDSGRRPDNLQQDSTGATGCNLCGSQRHKIVYSKKEQPPDKCKRYTITQDITSQPYQVVECLDCGLIYALVTQDKVPILKEYEDMKDELYLKEERGRRRAAKRVLAEISALKSPGKLLEVGSAAGLLLDEAKKLGWEVTGVEPSKWAADHARSNFNLNIIAKGIEDANLAKGYFDAVVLIDVLEHLTNPKSALEKIRQLLNPDGLLYIAVPDIKSIAARIFKDKWWGIKRHHLYYFDRDTLKAALDRTGLEVVKSSFYRRYFSLDYLPYLITTYNSRLADGLKRVFQRTSLENKNIPLNLYDQIAVYAKKKKLLRDVVDSKESRPGTFPKLKTVIVLPAYNAARTLKHTVSDIPDGITDDIILVDDKSSDNTVEIAKELGLKVFIHNKNSGYGANQKTCYEEALKLGADIVVMLHPDYQYDPKVIPQLIEPIKKGEADAVFGSRMMKGGALEGGMPKWKHDANILLTALENVILGTYLTEYHSGFRAYSRKLLEEVNFKLNSDGFIFDTEIIVQALLKKFKIEEIPIKTRYFDEASTIGFYESCLYGLGILRTLFKYILHVKGVMRYKQFL